MKWFLVYRVTDLKTSIGVYEPLCNTYVAEVHQHPIIERYYYYYYYYYFIIIIIIIERDVAPW